MARLSVKTLKKFLGDKTPKFPGKNKYGNIHTLCSKQYKHKSKGEAMHCDKLHMAHPECEILHEKPYPIVVNGVKICVHNPDWTVITPEGKHRIVEFKGMETGVWKIKYKLFKALYPHLPYAVIKK